MQYLTFITWFTDGLRHTTAIATVIVWKVLNFICEGLQKQPQRKTATETCYHHYNLT